MRVDAQQPNLAAIQQQAQQRVARSAAANLIDGATAEQGRGRGAIYTTTSFSSVQGPGPVDKAENVTPVRADRTAESPPPQRGDRGRLTLEGLRRAWGQSDSPYDLNGDNTVNVDDLVKFINAWPEDEVGPSDATVDGASVRETPTPADAAGDTGNADALTLEGLRAAWGQNDPRYDLNSDGTVNVDDLIAFLQQQSASAEAGGAAEALTLEGLRAAWGQSDSPYDLNDDNTVNVDDLIAFLQERSAAAGDESAGAGETLTVEGLRAAWGQTDSPYDLNSDGTVNVDDLLRFILDRSGSPEVADAAEPRRAPASLVSPEGHARRLTRLADSLINRLHEAGFRAQAPVDVHDIVDSLGLNDADRRSVVKHLANAYPGGLGINHRA